MVRDPFLSQQRGLRSLQAEYRPARAI